MSKISSQTNLQIIVVVVVIAAAILLGMTSLSQPAIMPASAPVEAFSAERAMAHIEIIAQEPHPVGSPEIEEIRDYIVAELEAMGLSPEIQQATSMVDLRGDVIAGTVYNIIARIPGTNPGQAIALNAHYDTMPQTPGASDCGSCVATLLETARALMAGPPLQNDVILVFADAEEYGPGLGSAAFVEQHPLADDVGVLLNFEGIGTTGPALIFRTSNDSGWLVREMVQATSLPVGQSWLNEILGMTPIGTDLIRYRDAGIDGIDFAYLTEGTVYHTMLDNPETIDARAIQHNGDYALSLTRHLGNQDLSAAGDTGGDAVYFSLVRGVMVTYPATWTVPLAVVVTTLLVGVGIVGGRKDQLSIRGILLGLLASLLAVVAAAGLANGLWFGIVRLQREYQSMNMGRVYNAHLYLFAFIALAVAIATTVHVLFRRKNRAAELAFGALMLWWLLAASTTFILPGLSYLYTWPLLFSTLAMGWVFWAMAMEEDSWQRRLILIIGAVPGIILYAPGVSVMFNFAPTTMIGVPIFHVALLLNLLNPQIDVMTRNRRWVLAGGTLLVSVALLVAGSLTAGFNAEHPRPNAVVYILNANTGQATWFSPNPDLDGWTEQFLSAEPEHGTLGDLFPLSFSETSMLTHEAPVVTMDAPQVEILDDQTAAGLRTLTLHLSSAQQAPVIMLGVQPRAAVHAVTIDGLRLDVPQTEDDLWRLTYYAVPAGGFNVALELDPSQPLTLQVSDNSRQLPEVSEMVAQPRSDDMIPMPNFDYWTVVVRAVEIP